jgi:hypothetical protein
VKKLVGSMDIEDVLQRFDKLMQEDADCGGENWRSLNVKEHAQSLSAIRTTPSNPVSRPYCKTTTDKPLRS